MGYGSSYGAGSYAPVPAYGYYPPYGYPGYPNYAGYPGYPAYPGYAAYAPYAGYAPPYPYPYAYPPYPYAYPRPRRPAGEVYALVIAWIVIAAAALSIACGMLAALGTILVLTSGGSESLAGLTAVTEFTIAPLVGGGLALYYGIRRVLGKPSPLFALPAAWLFAGLTALVLLADLIIWNLNRAPGAAVAVMPLAILSGVLPALAILALASQRLRDATSRRHLWISLVYGATLAPLLAIILEFIATILITLLFTVLGSRVSLASINGQGNPQSPAEVIVLLLVLSVVAPLVEEGVKPLGAVLIIRRLRTPAEAFLLGLAAGIGFNIFETIGYISTGEADWISVAIERIGAGLLHGVGAGMAALGWYYLINGRGVRLRWLRGVGCIIYAVLQHAVFNGSNLLALIPGPVGSSLNQPLSLIGLPVDSGLLLFFFYYALILLLLFVVTGRLARGLRASAAPTPPNSSPPAPSLHTEATTPLAGGIR